MRLSAVLKSVGIVLFFLLCSAVYLLIRYEKEIGEAVLEQLNEQIDGELSYADFQIQFIKSFPHIAVAFGQFELARGQERLLAAKALTVELDGLKLVQKKVGIQRIALSEGKAIVRKAKDGKTDWQRLLANRGGQGQRTNSIRLDDVQLNAFELLYKDEKSKDIYSFWFKDLRGSLRMLDRFVKLSADGEGRVNYLSVGGEEYAANTALDLTAQLTIDLNRSKYTIVKSKINLAGVRASVKGSITEKKDALDFQLRLDGGEATTRQLLRLFPAGIVKSAKDFELKGRHHFDIEFYGKKTDKKFPHIVVKSEIKGASIKLLSRQKPLEQIAVRMLLENRSSKDLKSWKVRFDELRAVWNGQKIQGNIQIRDFENPKYTGYFAGAVELEDLFLPDKNALVQKLKGTVYFDRIDIEEWAQTDDKDQLMPKISGLCSIRELKCDIAGQKVYIPVIDLELKDDSLSFQDIDIALGHSQLRLSGRLESLSALFVRQDKLELDAKIEAEKIDAMKLWSWYGRVSDQLNKTVQVSIDQKAHWYQKIRAKIDLSVAHLDYDKLDIAALAGRLIQEDNRVKMNFGFEAFQGEVSMDGSGTFAPQLSLSTKLSCSDIEVKDLFYCFDNFDQNFITHEHLSGRMDAKLFLKSYWDKAGNLLDKDVEADAFFAVRDGVLKDFELLNRFSKYIDSDALMDIRFSEMVNLLELRKGAVIIPTMYIQNSATNILLAGYHSIDQKIHYNLKLNAAQVLSRKLLKKKPKQIVPARKSGWFNMYFNISGTTDHFEYVLDKELVKRGFEHGEKKKQEVLKRLKKRFDDIPDFFEPESWADIPEYDTGYEEGKEEYLEDFLPARDSL